MRAGPRALLPVTTAYVVALGWAAVALPARVPAHFDAAGRVDDWSSRTGMLVFWAVVGLVVLAGGYVVLAAVWTVRLLRAYRPPVQTG